jgi:hypothetical protein
MKRLYILLTMALTGLSSFIHAQTGWQWANQVGSSGNESGYSIATDASGNSYFTGSFTSATAIFGTTTLNNTGGGGSDVFVVKYDASGNTVWAKNFGGTLSYNGSGVGKGIALDPGGNIYVTGWFLGTGFTIGSTTLANNDTNGFTSSEIFIAKLDPSGNILWANSGGGAIADQATSIAVDASGNSYITGPFSSSSISFGSTTLTTTNNTSIGMTDIFVAKYSSSGAFQWAKNYGGTYPDNANSICSDALGNIVVAGTFNSPSIAFGSTTLTMMAAVNLFYTKIDNAGNVIWAKMATATGSGSINNYANGVSMDGSGNIYMTGMNGANLSFGSVAITQSFFIVKFDSGGNAIWASEGSSSAGGISGNAIATDAAGNSYVAGNFDGTYAIFGTDSVANLNTAGSNTDIVVAKYNSSGILQWAEGAGGNYNNTVYGIACNNTGDALMTGGFTSTTMTFGSIVVNNSVPSLEDLFCAKIGTPMGIEEQTAQLNVSLYPNPSNGVFLIRSEEAITGIRIMNVLGERILNLRPDQQESRIDLSAYPKGTYFIGVLSDKKGTVKKVVLE